LPVLLYNILFPFLFLLYLPFYVARLLRRGGLDASFGERFGLFSGDRKKRLKELAAPVWIHAVSVGEVVAATGFMARWRQREPGVQFVLSTTTTTGHALARKKLPEDIPLLYCPVDFWPVVARVLSLVRPRMLVIFEVEFWPSLITLASRRGIAVVLANGRLSDKSASGYAKHAWFFRPLFRRFSLFCVQSDADAERMARVAGDEVPIHACDTMKFDQVPDSGGDDKGAALEEAFGPGKHLVWVAGSTHAAEEALVADTFLALKRDFPGLRLVLAPRHQERTAEVEGILRQRNLSCRLRDSQKGEGGDGCDVLLVNTTGELMGFYGAADIVFVGKSLAGCTGGHNIIEPAIFGKPVVHGPNMQNFRLVAKRFRDAGATVEVADDGQLLPAVRGLCESPGAREELSRKSRAVVESCRGAMDRTLDLILAVQPRIG
jgi:3-deoxy-D-manno-octulosonic-acid transferase